MQKIRPKKILFIKLGEGGKYEKDCIENSQTLRLGYREIDHSLCLKGNWKAVHNYFTDTLKTKDFVATSHTNQIRQFYEEDENTLWITFYANKLWWCFSKKEIVQLEDKSKVRTVTGRWHDKDINGKSLNLENISGKLVKTQGFRGTICRVLEEKYTLQKINGEQSQEIIEVEEAMHLLKEKLGQLIINLQWKDCEILIDLIFRQAGWQRIGSTGKTQKTLDLELFAPVTGERAIVQIKSQSDLVEFEYYVKEFANLTKYDKFFYIVHSPKENLKNYKNETEINILFINKVAELTISSGLVEWVIKKTS